MKCPVCYIELTTDGSDLVCPTAHGRLLSPADFQNLTGTEPKFTKRVICPDCGTNMNSMAAGEAPVSVCPTCRGVWMEYEEFKNQIGIDPKSGFPVKWAVRKEVCPVCKKAMGTVLTRGVEIDVCYSCGGVWLDSSELEMITGIDFKLSRRISCPACSGVMMPGLLYRVEIDVCPKCSSVWLDSGEKELLTERAKASTIAVQVSPATSVTPGVETIIKGLSMETPDQEPTIDDTAETVNVLEEFIENNMEFLKDGGRVEQITGHPKKRLAIISCMDPRLTYLLEVSLGIKRGDAYIIRNAGATMVDDSELLRSLAVALYASDVEEIIIIGHTDCNMAKINSFKVAEAMKERGLDPQMVSKGDVRTWLGGFVTETDNIRTTVERLRKSPMIPQDVPVHGILIDSNSGKAEIIVNGYGRTG